MAMNCFDATIPIYDAAAIAAHYFVARGRVPAEVHQRTMKHITEMFSRGEQRTSCWRTGLLKPSNGKNLRNASLWTPRWRRCSENSVNFSVQPTSAPDGDDWKVARPPFPHTMALPKLGCPSNGLPARGCPFHARARYFNLTLPKPLGTCWRLPWGCRRVRQKREPT